MSRSCMPRAPGLLAMLLATTLVAQPASAEFEFGIPTPMPEPFNLEGGYGYPWLSANELDIFFVSDRTGPNSGDTYSTGAFDIWTAHRESTSVPWGAFVNLGAPVNTPELAEIAPSFTADAQELYFMRALSPFGLPEGDLFVSHRQPDDSWGAPEPLAALNTPDGREAYPTISPDGLTLYFNTHLNTNYPNPTGLDWNMWVATRDSRSEPFDDPQFFYGGYGTVTADGLTHLIMGYPEFSDYYGLPHVGDADLFVRTRDSVDEEFGPVQLLRPPVNSSGQFLPPPLTGVGLECCAALSASGSTLYFTSVRPGTDASGPVGFVDLWQAPIAEAAPVDVKPGSYPNPVNLKSKGVLPVAVLSSDTFDATQIDIATLLFGDPLLIADGAPPVSPVRSSYEDVDYDGLEDLTLKFSMRELLDAGVIGSETVEGYLAGQLYDGTHIAGRDSVVVVPAGRFVPEPAGLLLMLSGLSVIAVWRRK